jgi:hypothetical protein
MRRRSILRVPVLATSLTQLVGANLGFLRSLAFRGAPFLGILVHGTHSGDQGKDSDPPQWGHATSEANQHQKQTASNTDQDASSPLHLVALIVGD